MSDTVYKPGLQAAHEQVISAHFMHEQNMRSDYHLYSDAEYLRESLPLPVACVTEELFPLLKAKVAEVAQLRSSAAIKRAEDEHPASAIAELVLDRWFRKGPRDHVDFITLRQGIAQVLASGKPVELVAPLLPFKKDSPLKTRGIHACMAEVDLLCRLGELLQGISIIRAHYGVPATRGPDAHFLILGDGSRFLTALNADLRQITDYQGEIETWISLLGLEPNITVIDYETFMRSRLPRSLLAQREGLRLSATELYQSRMAPLFDAADMTGTLNRAMEADPLPDKANPEGRFVPLFKSILYTHQYTFLHDYCSRHKVDFPELYREVTQHAFSPAQADFTPAQYRDVYDYVHDTTKPRPADCLIIEYLRRQMLRAAFNATISYLAVVKMDRDLMSDPIATLLPNHIRFTIHSKPGQIGLRTSTSTQSGSVVQPWHGVSLLRPDGCNRMKFDTVSRLMAESIGARPVILQDSACGSCNIEASPFASLASNQQPFFYLHPEIKVADCSALLAQLQTELTRKVN